MATKPPIIPAFVPLVPLAEPPKPASRELGVILVESKEMSAHTRAALEAQGTRPLQPGVKDAVLTVLHDAFHGTLAPHHAATELEVLWAEFLARAHLAGLAKKAG